MHARGEAGDDVAQLGCVHLRDERIQVGQCTRHFDDQAPGRAEAVAGAHVSTGTCYRLVPRCGQTCWPSFRLPVLLGHDGLVHARVSTGVAAFCARRFGLVPLTKMAGPPQMRHG